MNLSEQLFVRYCEINGYQCTKIEEGNSKTPDYEVKPPFSEGVVIVEIKEFQPNKDDIQAAHHFDEHKWALVGGQPGQRINRAIRRAAKQLKVYRQHPCLLLLYDNIVVGETRPCLRFLDPCFIDFGMYGLQTANLRRGSDGSLEHAGSGRGGKRQMTAGGRTYFGGVGTLHVDKTHDPYLTVYHNFYADIPVPPEFFRGPHDTHYVKPDCPDRCLQEWVVN